jgi:hypothetical protein
MIAAALAFMVGFGLRLLLNQQELGLRQKNDRRQTAMAATIVRLLSGLDEG